MKIVILDGYTVNPGDLSWDALNKLGELCCYDRTEPCDVLERLHDAEAVITNKVIFSDNLMARLPKLKYVGLFSTGVNVVDLEAAKKRGIVVTNIPKYSTDSVAQLTFAHILNLSFHLSQHVDSVRNGDWTRSIDFSYWNSPLLELSGLTFGSVGFGSIGKKCCETAKAFGMTPVAVRSHFVSNEQDGIRILPSLNDLLAQSDVVSLHCPLNEQSRFIINEKSISRMKKSAFLINTSRGGLVNEADLAAALNGGQIAGAGLDVLSAEPPTGDNPLLSAKNCFITPHFAWGTHAARKRLLNIAAENLSAFISGNPQNVVN